MNTTCVHHGNRKTKDPLSQLRDVETGVSARSHASWTADVPVRRGPTSTAHGGSGDGTSTRPRMQFSPRRGCRGGTTPWP
jgi:hypothetical protein